MPSYSQVFSQGFIYYNAASPNNQFEVPAGFTAVVRQISGTQNIGGFALILVLQQSDAAEGVIVAQIAADGVYNNAQLEGRWVVNEGGTITIGFTSLGSSYFGYAGGYLLRNTLA